ncbi:MAG: lysophospholipid acyltransferase family protein [Nitrospiraceae bacterium]
MFKRIVDWLQLHLLPPIGAGVIRLLGRTMSIRTEGSEAVETLSRQGQNLIYAFWHAQQLMMPIAYRGACLHILISRHRDGELIHRIIARFGFRSVRGSTTRGGVEALRELIRLGQAGSDLAVTPDGPKGPRQVAKMGVIQLAKATGLPIVPITMSCSKKNCSRVGIASWSRIHSAEVSFCGDNPYGYLPNRRMPNSKRNGVSWKRLSID